jgi:hypothetical protein
VTMPTSGIRKFDVYARPLCALFCAAYIAGDGAKDNNHDLRAKSPECLTKTNLATTAGTTTRHVIQMVYRLSTQVHQIATERAKGSEKIVVLNAGQRADKTVANRSVQPRISLVEKSSRRGRCFADEEHPHAARAITSAQTLSRNRRFTFSFSQPADTPQVEPVERRLRDGLSHPESHNSSGPAPHQISGQFLSEPQDPVAEYPGRR